jgi:DNA-binding MarR family transcriptional regulator
VSARPDPVDHETTAAPIDHRDLRLWLRLLTCTTLVETAIRNRLRVDFATTLPRFDLLAALDKAGGPLSMGAISRRLMVSNGNLTALAERLAADGLVSRTRTPEDRRTQILELTDHGRRVFKAMARRHEAWIAEAFGGLSDSEVETLMALLAKAKRSARRLAPEGETDE